MTHTQTQTLVDRLFEWLTNVIFRICINFFIKFDLTYVAFVININCKYVRARSVPRINGNWQANIYLHSFNSLRHLLVHLTVACVLLVRVSNNCLMFANHAHDFTVSWIKDYLESCLFQCNVSFWIRHSQVVDIATTILQAS